MRAANKVGIGGGPAPGQVSERYRLARALGGGGSSDVFLASDLARGDDCAVKLCRAGSEAESRRLLAEFARLAELSHRNVVRVRDLGRVREGAFAARPFLVIDHVPGAPITALADSPTARFEAAADDLADALAYLHGRGIIHGDLSPANIRLDREGRPVLLDFGLSERIDSRGGEVAGTLGYLAPEALVGERGPLADLYALGATLYAAWTGAPPFGTGLDAVRRQREGLPPAPSAVRPGLGAGWDELILGLLARAPEERPSSARELLREIRRLRAPELGELEVAAPFPQGDPLAGVFVGRRAERAELSGLLERLAEGTAPVSVVVVAGPVGSGRRALVERVLREARIAAVAGALPDFDAEHGGLAALATEGARAPVGELPLGGAWDEEARAAQGRLTAIAEALERRAAARPLCVVLPAGADEEALALAVAGAEPSGRLLVILAGDQRSRGHARVIALGPLARGEIAELAARAAGTAAPDPVVESLHRSSAGQPALAALLVRRWVREQREGRTGEPLEDGDLERQLDAGFRALGADARRLVSALALSVPGEQAERDAPAEAEAQAAGWLARDPAGSLALPSPLHQAAVFRSLASPELRAVARAACAALPEGDPRLGEAFLAAGERGRATAAFRAAARSAFSAGRSAEAARHWLSARALSPELPLGELLALSAALGVAGRYSEALDALAGAPAASPLEQAALAERRAWILTRRGELAAARATLEAALGELDAGAGEARRALAGRLARVLVSAGDLAGALTVAEPALAEEPGATVAREAAVLALVYGGRVADAEALIVDGGPPPAAARAHFLRGLCHQGAGRLELAAAAYRASAEAHAALRDRHTAASSLFNLGCVLAEAGSYGEALAAFEAAIRDLGRLGAVVDLAVALFDSGLLFIQLGDLASAGRTVQRTRGEGRARRLPLFDAYAACLEADLRRRQGGAAAAVALYDDAARAFTAAGNQLLADTSRLARAEALAECGQPAAALVAWRAVAERAGEGAPPEGLALARARIALVAAPAPEDAALAEELGALSAKATEAGRRPVAWRASALAARLAARLRDPGAAAHRERARKIFEEVKMLSPVKFRSGLDTDPDAPAPESPGAAAVGVLVDRAARAENRLRRLIRINKRLNSELRLGRVLETIVDTVIELTDAERGFLLLKDGAGELQIKVARNIEQSTLDDPEFALSRSIAKQAADRGEPVITVDAAGDERFRLAMSVTDLRLRSVLAVPLAVKGNVVGTIYVDHRLRKGVFDDDDVALVLDFAEQGAIAIENARLLAELRRRERQVDGLNRRLERDLKARHEELSDVRQELKESREAAALRYDYRQIVGRTPRMVELFRLLDRVTDTSLPVVVQGESGTGKELVARAIHFNGPRRERPFVSENCAAIPETLLESTLFGYVKGAFTGADRETRGLFAVADGGTLFLDEVAEMSPAMQGKLLRVLQDGEFRRVGGERPQKVDVRIVVATNKDLARLVSDGKFRQDLFFRLSVVRLTLPPLRERREDIPLLVEGFLDRFALSAAPGERKGVEPAAIAKLMGYRWPGNVRELENEILRAAAFAGPRITVADLSPHVAAGADGAAPDEGGLDSLLLRPRIERLERTLIREALTQHGGNQTRAAEALGLSRFGLQKKLRRYGLA